MDSIDKDRAQDVCDEAGVTTADPWQEFEGMTADEAHMALAFLSGYDEALFARVIERTRAEVERRRLRAQVSAACRRAGDAEAT